MGIYVRCLYKKRKFGQTHTEERLMLKLKLQYFVLLMQNPDSLEKTLILGEIEGRRRRGQKMRWLDGTLTRWT